MSSLYGFPTYFEAKGRTKLYFAYHAAKQASASDGQFRGRAAPYTKSIFGRLGPATH